MVISKPKIIFNRNSIPQVDLNFMNKTHFEEVEMVKELGDLITSCQECSDNNKSNEITKTLKNWFKHTEAHFARENALMLKTHFPAHSIHSQEHESALNMLSTIINEWQAGHNLDALAEYVFVSWPNWFNRHVDTMDTITAHFAVMNGYTEENETRDN